MAGLLLLGLGRWGRNHLRVLRSLPGVDLWAADPSADARSAALESGFPADRLLGTASPGAAPVEAAVIVTPADSHFALAQECLTAGKHVLVEKPLAPAAVDCRRLAELADARRRVLRTGHLFRFDSAAQEVRRRFRQGDFGPPRLLRATFSGFKRPRNDTGVLLADAIHFIDLFVWILDALPRRVTARFSSPLGRGAGREDAAWLWLDFETSVGPVSTVIEADYFQPGKHRRLTLVGAEGSAVCDFDAPERRLVLQAQRHCREADGFRAVAGLPIDIPLPRVEPLRAELEEFIGAIHGRDGDGSDGWAGTAAARIAEAAQRSAHEGRTVELDSMSGPTD